MPGDLRIMFGVRKKKSGQIAWGLTKTSERAFNFAMASPSPKIATEKRLAFYVRHLEHADEFIAKDAYIEFLNAGIEDYRKISMDLPREKLLAWTLDDNPESRRQGVYGILLGICGDGETARKLESRILEDDTQFRIGIDGVMSGYLMLTGEEGLDLLEPRKFREGVAFVETYALLQAVRFMWRYGEGRISDARLQQSVRILLDNPDVFDLIIPDLARMEDWSCLDRIVALYDREKFNTPATKRAIIRYLLISSREVVFKLKDDRNLTDEISRRSKEHLDAIRKRDPRQVTQVLRFSILWK